MLTTRDLTDAERLVVFRRRKGQTKAQAAKRCGVTLYRYSAWESGESEPDRKVSVGKLEQFEALHALRRRAGASVADMAKAVGVSNWWLTQIEAGAAPVERLLDFWRGCGGGADFGTRQARRKVGANRFRAASARAKRS